MLTWAKKNAPGQLATRLLEQPIDGNPMGVWRIEKPAEAVEGPQQVARPAAAANKGSSRKAAA